MPRIIPKRKSYLLVDTLLTTEERKKYEVDFKFDRDFSASGNSLASLTATLMLEPVPTTIRVLERSCDFLLHIQDRISFYRSIVRHTNSDSLLEIYLINSQGALACKPKKLKPR